MALVRRERNSVVNENISRQYLDMPHVESGMVIGLFGGSFNPPHNGHLLVAETAIERLNLDQLWWIVTPGNPLKSSSELMSLSERIADCEALATDLRIKVTAFEKKLGVSYTANTIANIKTAHPDVNFIWIMGADNLSSFHEWQKWEEITETIPIAVVDRPGSTHAYLSSVMAKTYINARVDEEDAAILWTKKAPAWMSLHGPRSSLSSTQIRNERASKQLNQDE